MKKVIVLSLLAVAVIVYVFTSAKIVKTGQGYGKVRLCRI